MKASALRALPIGWARRIRRLAGKTKRLVMARRVVTVRTGPAAGLRIGLHLASADYGAGTNESPVQQVFVDHLRPGQVVYDIGANVGFFALLGARLVGVDGAVHAFEASPRCARALERNKARNHFEQISIHPVAVRGRAGPVELFQGRHPGGATVSERDRPADLRSVAIVPGLTIDGLVDQQGLPPPNLVKIDVEGAEVEVIRGMSALIERHHPVVVCEIDDRTEGALDAKRRQVTDALEDLGYELADLQPSYSGSRSLVVHLLARPVLPGGGRR